MHKVLFIVAHPDDAELAAGGTIKKLSSANALVRVINLTVSENTEETRRLRISAAENAARILGHELVWYNKGLYNQVEDIKMYELVAYIDSCISEFKPTKIFTHTNEDSHYDHVITSRAVVASTRKWKGGTLYFMPPNELRSIHFSSFAPNAYCDISIYIDQKLEALNCYNSFQGNIFRPLNTGDFKLVNSYFGMAAGCAYAEGFIIKKQAEIVP
jgi:LmbE family N-acetylglucosaminyl deacetylase